jgi:phosphatidylserine decarboxylase
MNKLFVLIQTLVPQHALSRLVAVFANSKVGFIKDTFIRGFIKRYKVDMSEARFSDVDNYNSFNDFFTRELRSDARPVSEIAGAVVSPADGTISELGQIENDQMLQAKGKYYFAMDLLGGSADDVEPFKDGNFATIYLSPRDYHRVHMPIAGALKKTIYIPGKLFSVNQTTADAVPGLFAKNERLVCFFETELGPVAIVMVGAMIVAGIETVWAGAACPNNHGIAETLYLNHSPPIQLSKGVEMGRFMLGSTVILLFGPGMVKLENELTPNSDIRMGELLATCV